VAEPHGHARGLGRATWCRGIGNGRGAPWRANLAPDDAAQRGDQAEQPEPTSLEHPVQCGAPSATWFSRHTTGSGVAAGTHHITQVKASKPGSTVSATVGVSGRAGTRRPVVTASAFRPPWRIWPMAEARSTKLMSTRPARTSVSAGAEPRKGTCVITVPVLSD